MGTVCIRVISKVFRSVAGDCLSVAQTHPSHPEILENASTLPTSYATVIYLGRPGVAMHL